MDYLNNTSRKGFTLVEIMIVVVIIGILAAIAVPQFATVKNKSTEKSLVNDGRLIGSAIQQAAVESGSSTVAVAYTATTGEWVVTGGTATYEGSLSNGVVGTAVSSLDIDTGTFVLTHPQYKSTGSVYATTGLTAGGLIFNASGQVNE